MPSSMRTVMQLNNSGVCSLEKGDCESATNFLQGALLQLRSLLTENQTLPSTSKTDDFDDHEDGDAVPEICLQSRRISSSSKLQGCCSPPQNEDDSCPINIFDKAFVIKPATMGSLSQSRPSACEHEVKISSALLYNRGLSHHLNAVRLISATEFKKAKSHYKLALELLETDDSDQSQDDPCIWLLVFALMNNMAHIEANHHFNYAHTNRCIDWIRQAMDSLDSFFFSEEDYFFFFVHYYVTPPAIFACSPAA